jgi:cathepsin C
MEEIIKNGPVVMNFEPTYEFMYYERGIYFSKDAAGWITENQTKPDWVIIA